MLRQGSRGLSWALMAFALSLALVVSGSHSAVAGELPDTSKMNVLMIDIEDCRADVWGCFGNAICQTPNIDRLAATGVAFDRAYCQYVCCNQGQYNSIRTKRHRYTEWKHEGKIIKELYDHQSDPWETNNLADKSEYASEQQRLAAMLAQGWRAVN